MRRRQCRHLSGESFGKHGHHPLDQLRDSLGHLCIETSLEKLLELRRGQDAALRSVAHLVVRSLRALRAQLVAWTPTAAEAGAAEGSAAPRWPGLPPAPTLLLPALPSRRAATDCADCCGRSRSGPPSCPWLWGPSPRRSTATSRAGSPSVSRPCSHKRDAATRCTTATRLSQ